MIGTPAYMPPEIWRSKPASPASDVYSLACVFYEMVTGQVLFAGESPPEIMTKHILDGPQLLVEWLEDTPARVGQVLAKALAREPDDRYPNAGAFATAVVNLKSAPTWPAATAPTHLLTIDEPARPESEAVGNAMHGKAQAVQVATEETEHIQLVAPPAQADPPYSPAAVEKALPASQASRVISKATHKATFNWKAVGLISLGWAISGYIIWNPAIGWASGRAIGLYIIGVITRIISEAIYEITIQAIGGAINGAVSGAIGGLSTGLVLWKAKAISNWKSVLGVVLGWAISWAIGWAISWSTDMDVIGWYIIRVIEGAIGGLGTGLVLWKTKAISNWKSVLGVVLGWAIGWAIGWATGMVNNWFIGWVIGWVISGTAIAGAIGSSAMLWLLRHDKQKAESQPSKRIL